MKYLAAFLALFMCSAAFSAGLDDIHLRDHTDLVSQASSSIQNQQYQKALIYMESAVSLAPNIAENHFLYCMLKERTGKPESKTKPCYKKVVMMLSQDKFTSCEKNINCIIADLMAEGPKAEARKHKFLEKPATSTEAEVARYLLNDFDRTKFLQSILP